MTFTNRLDLPQAYVDAVVANEEEHVKADFSVTELLKGDTEIALNMLHGSELVCDVSDRFNTLLGSAIHSILEKFGGQESEIYMVADIDGTLVSGTADRIDDDLITDWKSCASWKITYNDFDDWRKQLIAYAFLWWGHTRKTILNGRIIAFIKDWSPTQAERDKSYPQSPVVPINFKWTYEDMMEVPVKWSEKIDRIHSIINRMEFPPCSEEDRWHEPDKWALMKTGRKTAIKLYDSEKEADDACTENGMHVEYRPGNDKKCDRYCDVGRCGFCPHYNKTHKKENENETSES